MDVSDRLRPHPDNRFEGPQHEFDLEKVATSLLAEPLPQSRKHRQQTLYHHGAVTVAMFVFEAGGHLAKHVTGGVVTVQVLQGRLQMTVEGRVHDMATGKMLVMAPGVPHDVHALEPTRMLLTVSLEQGSTATSA